MDTVQNNMLTTPQMDVVPPGATCNLKGGAVQNNVLTTPQMDVVPPGATCNLKVEQSFGMPGNTQVRPAYHQAPTVLRDHALAHGTPHIHLPLGCQD